MREPKVGQAVWPVCGGTPRHFHVELLWDTTVVVINKSEFQRRIARLVGEGQERQAEQELISARSTLRAAGDIWDQEFIVREMAHFYSLPTTEDQDKAEACYLECERLSPSPLSLSDTATFYFYVAADCVKTIAKVDEIKARWDVSSNDGYYSAMTLKGQALLDLGDVDGAKYVLEEILAMIRANAALLPYGDELNFLEAAITEDVLANGCCEALRLIIPRIRSQEYVERAQGVLSGCVPE
jgi:hypothetical protein